MSERNLGKGSGIGHFVSRLAHPESYFDSLKPVDRENMTDRLLKKKGIRLGTTPSEEHPIGGPVLGSSHSDEYQVIGDDSERQG